MPADGPCSAVTAGDSLAQPADVAAIQHLSKPVCSTRRAGTSCRAMRFAHPPTWFVRAARAAAHADQPAGAAARSSCPPWQQAQRLRQAAATAAAAAPTASQRVRRLLRWRCDEQLTVAPRS